jgi:hypothetical protein
MNDRLVIRRPREGSCSGPRAARNRASLLRKFAGVAGIEAVSAAPTDRKDQRATDGKSRSDQDARGPSRIQAVASLATALADAVLAGDHDRARALAEELRALAAQPAARSPAPRQVGAAARDGLPVPHCRGSRDLTSATSRKASVGRGRGLRGADHASSEATALRSAEIDAERR